jgi:hypothetical protein
MKISELSLNTGILYALIAISSIVLIGCLYCAYTEYQLAFVGKNIIN